MRKRDKYERASTYSWTKLNWNQKLTILRGFIFQVHAQQTTGWGEREKDAVLLCNQKTKKMNMKCNSRQTDSFWNQQWNIKTLFMILLRSWCFSINWKENMNTHALHNSEQHSQYYSKQNMGSRFSTFVTTKKRSINHLISYKKKPQLIYTIHTA